MTDGAAPPTNIVVEQDQIAGLSLDLAYGAGASVNGAGFSIDDGWTAQ